MVPNVATIIEPLTDLSSRAKNCNSVDVVYVNDIYGDFSADHSDILRAALEGERPDLVSPIIPEDGCRMLTKVRHSAFYSTPLGYLLGQLRCQRGILTGQVIEQCILYSALDADVRHFEVVVPTDGVAHIDRDLANAALRMIARNMGAEWSPRPIATSSCRTASEGAAGCSAGGKINVAGGPSTY